jgi:hypothetical protein
MIKRFFIRVRKNKRGQSFVELMLVISILALLLAGVVEFGFLMNNYFHILDAARESARFSSNSDPFDVNHQTEVVFYYTAAYKALDTMAPIVLDPTKGDGDDIVISVFSMTEAGAVLRFPVNDGWSLCAHVGDFESWMNSRSVPLSADAFVPAKWVGCRVRQSRMPTTHDVSRPDLTSFQEIILQTPGAPSAGAILVEVFYNYPELLKLPVFTAFITDPIKVYIYSVMPLPAGAPTPTPIIP